MTRISKYNSMTKEELLEVVTRVNARLLKCKLDEADFEGKEHHELIEALIVLEGDLYQEHSEAVRDIKKVFDELTGMLDNMVHAEDK